MKTAIHYTSVNQSIPGTNQIYGIQVAVLDWIRAYFRYSRQETFTFLVNQKQAADDLGKVAIEAGIDLGRIKLLSDRFPRQDFGQFDTIFHPEPDPRHFLWQRNLSPDLTYSFCGLAHALAGKDCGAILARYCDGPSTEADAIVCPSRAIKNVIENYHTHYADYISEHYGASYHCPIDLPVIPLGVEIEKIESKVTPDIRQGSRNALNLGEDDVAVLWVGRLSHYMKTHPISMFRAVEEAAQKTDKNIHLLMQGYFFPEEAQKDFEELAATICTKAKVTFIASNDPRFPDGLWAAGDIFLSLIDNIQESFGLTPIEAIAAGLPRVLSNWDGYRDSAHDGEDAFLIPTLLPPKGNGQALAELVIGGREPHAVYLAKTAACTAIDHHAAAHAILVLAESPELRASMAEKAKERLDHYRWSNIIPAYEDLWGELHARKKPRKQLPLVHPHAPDPFTLYEPYASETFRETDFIRIEETEGSIDKLVNLNINKLAHDVVLPPEAFAALLDKLKTGEEIAVDDLLQTIAPSDKPRLIRTLVWLLKLGVISRNRT